MYVFTCEKCVFCASTTINAVELPLCGEISASVRICFGCGESISRLCEMEKISLQMDTRV